MGSLTQIQSELIAGSMLGDGSLRKPVGNRHSLFEVNHAVRQRKYVDWKYQILQSLVPSPPVARKGKGSRVAYRFTTQSTEEFSNLRKKWYPDGTTKRIPLYLEITQMVLAVWFMDDGSCCGKSIYLNTQQFPTDDQKYLLALLKERWGVSGNLNRDKTYYRILLTADSGKRLRRILRNRIIPSMRYKLGKTP